MAKQIVNNGDTGLVARNKINENFTENYEAIALNTDKTGITTQQATDITTNKTKIANIENLTTVANVADTFTLDLENEAYKNFKIISADANAKTIVFDNVDATDSLIAVSVLIVYTTACAITMPTGFVINGGGTLPTATNGQAYWYAFESIDGGATGVIYPLRRV